MTGLNGLWANMLQGPLSTTLRLLPRVFSAISPTRLLSQTAKTIGRKGNAKISRSRKGRAEKVLELVQEAEEAGCDKVWRFRGRLRMFPPRGIKQDLAAAYEAYKKHLEIEPDPEAQFILGVLHSTGLGGIPIDQGKALLYYTFAAAQGYRPAAMALGYRHWAGIGVKEDCGVALEHYSHAADICKSIPLFSVSFDKTFELTFSLLQPIDVSSTVPLVVSLFPSPLSACLTVWVVYTVRMLHGHQQAPTLSVLLSEHLSLLPEGKRPKRSSNITSIIPIVIHTSTLPVLAGCSTMALSTSRRMGYLLVRKA